MPKYYLFTGPLSHLSHFKKKGYVQQNFNHKKRLEKLSIGDYIVFYASRESSSSTEPYRKIIAIGRITDDKIKTVTVDKKKFHRMKAKFYNYKETPLSEFINDLDFIKNKKYYGLYFISGFREISKHDFNIIRKR